MTEPILTLDREYKSNADLIVACRDLGYLSGDMEILDATYGFGRFWNKWSPPGLITNDLDPAKGYHHYDYRELPVSWAGRFDAVVFDPEYKLNGTSTGEGPASSDADYGVAGEYRPVSTRVDGWLEGFDECVRVCKPGGHILVKLMDQVVSGGRRFLARELWMHTVAPARSWAPTLVDELYLYGFRKQPERTRKCPTCEGSGHADPSNTTDSKLYGKHCADCDGTGRVESPQVHAQQSLSSLSIYRKPRK